MIKTWSNTRNINQMANPPRAFVSHCRNMPLAMIKTQDRDGDINPSRNTQGLIVQPPFKKPHSGSLITFSDEDVINVQVPHNNPLVVSVVINHFEV